MSTEPRTLDVRPILLAGGEPFGAIMEAVENLGAGQALRLLVNFKPVPLFAVMEQKGFHHSERTMPDGDWEVLFSRPRESRAAGNGVGATTTRDDVESALRDVLDPELGYNIVDLGLIYGIAIGGDRVTVTMTMTTHGCPAADAIRDGARERIASIPGVGEATVEVVWEPEWTPARMSEAAKAHFGFSSPAELAL